MTFSNPIRGTSTKKIKLNWWEYWIGHCWMTGWQTMRSTFVNWFDLMTSNYENYALLKEDDPEAECIEWFWVSLNTDDVYSRGFLEYLQQLVDDIETGKEKLIPLDEDFFDRIKNLGEDVDLDEDELQ